MRRTAGSSARPSPRRPQSPTMPCRRTGEAECATFEITFDRDTELTGYMKLRVFMSCAEGDDMDVFVGLHKLDANGAPVPFAYYAQFDDGPVALGWLRASHRELDLQKSTEWQPVHTHARVQKIVPGEIVPLDIEIWPSGTRFKVRRNAAPDSSRHRHQPLSEGQGAGLFPPRGQHEPGRHIIHSGGEHQSYLLVPVV